MPSDPRLQPSLQALRVPIATFRSQVASARERVRALLATDGGTEHARLELGAFGGARIDVSRFAELRKGAVLDALSRGRLARASAVLDEIDASDDTIFTVDVAPGDSLRVAAARALAHTGRAFAASSVAELVRSGRYEPERHDRILDAFPFERWSRTEREHAPPLILTVDGADLRAGSLAELLDVGMRLVLLVRGASTPAPLVRLVAPGTLVIQTRNVEALGRVADSPGPAIAAIFEQPTAIFTHDPLAGGSLWQRLSIVDRSLTSGRTSIAGISPRQQREELLQLEALAVRPSLPNAPIDARALYGASGDGDPADRLTAWLLAESGLANDK
jgi:hypothetical protein